MYHTPVLLTESISGLITCTKGIYVDLTFGGEDIHGLCCNNWLPKDNFLGLIKTLTHNGTASQIPDFNW